MKNSFSKTSNRDINKSNSNTYNSNKQPLKLNTYTYNHNKEKYNNNKLHHNIIEFTNKKNSSKIFDLINELKNNNFNRNILNKDNNKSNNYKNLSECFVNNRCNHNNILTKHEVESKINDKVFKKLTKSLKKKPNISYNCNINNYSSNFNTIATHNNIIKNNNNKNSLSNNFSYLNSVSSTKRELKTIDNNLTSLNLNNDDFRNYNNSKNTFFSPLTANIFSNKSYNYNSKFDKYNYNNNKANKSFLTNNSSYIINNKSIDSNVNAKNQIISYNNIAYNFYNFSCFLNEGINTVLYNTVLIQRKFREYIIRKQQSFAYNIIKLQALWRGHWLRLRLNAILKNNFKIKSLIICLKDIENKNMKCALGIILTYSLFNIKNNSFLSNINNSKINNNNNKIYIKALLPYNLKIKNNTTNIKKLNLKNKVNTKINNNNIKIDKVLITIDVTNKIINLVNCLKVFLLKKNFYFFVKNSYENLYNLYKKKVIINAFKSIIINKKNKLTKFYYAKWCYLIKHILKIDIKLKSILIIVNNNTRKYKLKYIFNKLKLKLSLNIKDNNYKSINILSKYSDIMLISLFKVVLKNIFYKFLYNIKLQYFKNKNIAFNRNKQFIMHLATLKNKKLKVAFRKIEEKDIFIRNSYKYSKLKCINMCKIISKLIYKKQIYYCSRKLYNYYLKIKLLCKINYMIDRKTRISNLNSLSYFYKKLLDKNQKCIIYKLNKEIKNKDELFQKRLKFIKLFITLKNKNYTKIQQIILITNCLQKWNNYVYIKKQKHELYKKNKMLFERDINIINLKLFLFKLTKATNSILKTYSFNKILLYVNYIVTNNITCKFNKSKLLLINSIVKNNINKNLKNKYLIRCFIIYNNYKRKLIKQESKIKQIEYNNKQKCEEFNKSIFNLNKIIYNLNQDVSNIEKNRINDNNLHLNNLNKKELEIVNYTNEINTLNKRKKDQAIKHLVLILNNKKVKTLKNKFNNIVKCCYKKRLLEILVYSIFSKISFSNIKLRYYCIFMNYLIKLKNYYILLSNAVFAINIYLKKTKYIHVFNTLKNIALVKKKKENDIINFKRYFKMFLFKKMYYVKNKYFSTWTRYNKLENLNNIKDINHKIQLKNLFKINLLNNFYIKTSNKIVSMYFKHWNYLSSIDSNLPLNSKTVIYLQSNLLNKLEVGNNKYNKLNNSNNLNIYEDHINKKFCRSKNKNYLDIISNKKLSNFALNNYIEYNNYNDNLDDELNTALNSFKGIKNLVSHKFIYQSNLSYINKKLLKIFVYKTMLNYALKQRYLIIFFYKSKNFYLVIKKKLIDVIYNKYCYINSKKLISKISNNLLKSKYLKRLIIYTEKNNQHIIYNKYFLNLLYYFYKSNVNKKHNINNIFFELRKVFKLKCLDYSRIFFIRINSLFIKKKQIANYVMSCDIIANDKINIYNISDTNSTNNKNYNIKLHQNFNNNSIRIQILKTIKNNHIVNENQLYITNDEDLENFIKYNPDFCYIKLECQTQSKSLIKSNKNLTFNKIDKQAFLYKDNSKSYNIHETEVNSKNIKNMIHNNSKCNNISEITKKYLINHPKSKLKFYYFSNCLIKLKKVIEDKFVHNPNNKINKLKFLCFYKLRNIILNENIFVNSFCKTIYSSLKENRKFIFINYFKNLYINLVKNESNKINLVKSLINTFNKLFLSTILLSKNKLFNVLLNKSKSRIFLSYYKSIIFKSIVFKKINNLTNLKSSYLSKYISNVKNIKIKESVYYRKIMQLKVVFNNLEKNKNLCNKYVLKTYLSKLETLSFSSFKLLINNKNNLIVNSHDLVLKTSLNDKITNYQSKLIIDINARKVMTIERATDKLILINKLRYCMFKSIIAIFNKIKRSYIRDFKSNLYAKIKNTDKLKYIDKRLFYMYKIRMYNLHFYKIKEYSNKIKEFYKFVNTIKIFLNNFSYKTKKTSFEIIKINNCNIKLYKEITYKNKLIFTVFANKINNTLKLHNLKILNNIFNNLKTNNICTKNTNILKHKNLINIKTLLIINKLKNNFYLSNLKLHLLRNLYNKRISSEKKSINYKIKNSKHLLLKLNRKLNNIIKTNIIQKKYNYWKTITLSKYIIAKNTLKSILNKQLSADLNYKNFNFTIAKNIKEYVLYKNKYNFVSKNINNFNLLKNLNFLIKRCNNSNKIHKDSFNTFNVLKDIEFIITKNNNMCLNENILNFSIYKDPLFTIKNYSKLNKLDNCNSFNISTDISYIIYNSNLKNKFCCISSINLYNDRRYYINKINSLNRVLVTNKFNIPIDINSIVKNYCNNNEKTSEYSITYLKDNYYILNQANNNNKINNFFQINIAKDYNFIIKAYNLYNKIIKCLDFSIINNIKTDMIYRLPSILNSNIVQFDNSFESIDTLLKNNTLLINNITKLRRLSGTLNINYNNDIKNSNKEYKGTKNTNNKENYIINDYRKRLFENIKNSIKTKQRNNNNVDAYKNKTNILLNEINNQNKLINNLNNSLSYKSSFNINDDIRNNSVLDSLLNKNNSKLINNKKLSVSPKKTNINKLLENSFIKKSHAIESLKNVVRSPNKLTRNSCLVNNLYQKDSILIALNNNQLLEDIMLNNKNKSKCNKEIDIINKNNNSLCNNNFQNLEINKHNNINNDLSNNKCLNKIDYQNYLKSKINTNENENLSKHTENLNDTKKAFDNCKDITMNDKGKECTIILSKSTNSSKLNHAMILSSDNGNYEINSNNNNNNIFNLKDAINITPFTNKNVKNNNLDQNLAINDEYNTIVTKNTDNNSKLSTNLNNKLIIDNDYTKNKYLLKSNIENNKISILNDKYQKINLNNVDNRIDYLDISNAIEEVDDNEYSCKTKSISSNSNSKSKSQIANNKSNYKFEYIRNISNSFKNVNKDDYSKLRKYYLFDNSLKEKLHYNNIYNFSKNDKNINKTYSDKALIHKHTNFICKYIKGIKTIKRCISFEYLNRNDNIYRYNNYHYNTEKDIENENISNKNININSLSEIGKEKPVNNNKSIENKHNNSMIVCNKTNIVEKQQIIYENKNNLLLAKIKPKIHSNLKIESNIKHKRKLSFTFKCPLIHDLFPYIKKSKNNNSYSYYKNSSNIKICSEKNLTLIQTPYFSNNNIIELKSKFSKFNTKINDFNKDNLSEEKHATFRNYNNNNNTSSKYLFDPSKDNATKKSINDENTDIIKANNIKNKKCFSNKENIFYNNDYKRKDTIDLSPIKFINNTNNKKYITDNINNIENIIKDDVINQDESNSTFINNNFNENNTLSLANIDDNVDLDNNALKTASFANKRSLTQSSLNNKKILFNKIIKNEYKETLYNKTNESNTFTKYNDKKLTSSKSNCNLNNSNKLILNTNNTNQYKKNSKTFKTDNNHNTLVTQLFNEVNHNKINNKEFFKKKDNNHKSNDILNNTLDINNKYTDVFKPLFPRTNSNAISKLKIISSNCNNNDKINKTALIRKSKITFPSSIALKRIKLEDTKDNLFSATGEQIYSIYTQKNLTPNLLVNSVDYNNLDNSGYEEFKHFIFPNKDSFNNNLVTNIRGTTNTNIKNNDYFNIEENYQVSDNLSNNIQKVNNDNESNKMNNNYFINTNNSILEHIKRQSSNNLQSNKNYTTDEDEGSFDSKGKSSNHINNSEEDTNIKANDLDIMKLIFEEIGLKTKNKVNSKNSIKISNNNISLKKSINKSNTINSNNKINNLKKQILSKTNKNSNKKTSVITSSKTNISIDLEESSNLEGCKLIDYLTNQFLNNKNTNSVNNNNKKLSKNQLINNNYICLNKNKQSSNTKSYVKAKPSSKVTSNTSNKKISSASNFNKQNTINNQISKLNNNIPKEIKKELSNNTIKKTTNDLKDIKILNNVSINRDFDSSNINTEAILSETKAVYGQNYSTQKYESFINKFQFLSKFCNDIVFDKINYETNSLDISFNDSNTLVINQSVEDISNNNVKSKTVRFFNTLDRTNTLNKLNDIDRSIILNKYNSKANILNSNVINKSREYTDKEIEEINIKYNKKLSIDTKSSIKPFFKVNNSLCSLITEKENQKLLEDESIKNIDNISFNNYNNNYNYEKTSPQTSMFDTSIIDMNCTNYNNLMDVSNNNISMFISDNANNKRHSILKKSNSKHIIKNNNNNNINNTNTSNNLSSSKSFRLSNNSNNNWLLNNNFNNNRYNTVKRKSILPILKEDKEELVENNDDIIINLNNTRNRTSLISNNSKLNNSIKKKNANYLSNSFYLQALIEKEKDLRIKNILLRVKDKPIYNKLKLKDDLNDSVHNEIGLERKLIAVKNSLLKYFIKKKCKIEKLIAKSSSKNVFAYWKNHVRFYKDLLPQFKIRVMNYLVNKKLTKQSIIKWKFVTKVEINRERNLIRQKTNDIANSLCKTISELILKIKYKRVFENWKLYTYNKAYVRKGTKSKNIKLTKRQIINIEALKKIKKIKNIIIKHKNILKISFFKFRFITKIIKNFN